MNPDYNAVTATLALLTAAIAVVALWLEGRRSRLALQTDLLLKLDEKCYNTEMRETHRNAAKKLLAPENPNSEHDYLLDFFNTIGILLERKALDMDLTYRMFKYRATRYRDCAQEHIQKERLKDPEFLSTLERLIAKLANDRQKRKLAPINPTQEELRSFLLEESCV